jgi:acyl-CoA hydrolase
MIVGIRVEAENIRTGIKKHCNSSYFTMVAKDTLGNNAQVPGLLLSNLEEVRRFYNCVKQVAVRKEQDLHEVQFDYKSEEALKNIEQYNAKLELST